MKRLIFLSLAILCACEESAKDSPLAKGAKGLPSYIDVREVSIGGKNCIVILTHPGAAISCNHEVWK